MPPSAPTPPGLPVTAVTALLTVLVTAVARLAYEDAYRQVGTTLDAVGLSNARLLTFGATVALTLTGLALLSVLAGGLLRHRLRASGRDQFADESAALCAIAVFAALVWLGLAYAESLTFFVSLGTAVGLPLLAYVDLDSRLSRLSPARESWCIAALNRSRTSIAVTVLLLPSLLAALLLSKAAAAGRALAAAGPVAAQDGVAGLLDLAPVPVCVRGLDGIPLPGLAPPQLLLGTNAGVHILLAPGPAARAQFVPAASVRLQGQPAAGNDGLPACP